MSKKKSRTDKTTADETLAKIKVTDSKHVGEKMLNENSITETFNGDSKNIFTIVGTNIRRERISRGFSIDLLAELLGLSAPFVGLIERGERGTTLKNLLKICKVFSITLDDIVREYESEHAYLMSERSYEPKTKREEKLDQLRSLLGNMNENELDFLVNVIKEYHMLRYKEKNMGLSEEQNPDDTQ